jgi:hypothetical protein
MLAKPRKESNGTEISKNLSKQGQKRKERGSSSKEDST